MTGGDSHALPPNLFSGGLKIMMLRDIESKLKNHKPSRITNSRSKIAAVIIALFIKDDKPFVIFTKRTETVQVHKGQCSFPGGHFEKPDKDLKTTALRELEEEIGIFENQINIIGQIDDVETTTGYLITPFVGFIKELPEYKINPDEIERVIEIPLDFLLNSLNWKDETYVTSNRKFKGRYCIYKEDKIWGATAHIMNLFTKLIS